MSPGAASSSPPDISVVTIVYNDAERLATAVRSALDQTLDSIEIVIVDDCSTDRSFDVAKELEIRYPGRIRAYQLVENSGGCGGPRNEGIARARGRYVMFLDSDDTLEVNACRNMLEAAERTGADIVSGLCVRVGVDSPRRKREEWYGWLYRTTRTLESVTELPDLFVWDTLSTNKCYRHGFLLENALNFPQGVMYEDLIFVAEAYLAAGRIALIPNEVYFWHVYSQAQIKSITNRRHEVRNYAHRLEMHRRIDALLALHELTELKRAKDVKFLKHDLVLHLQDLPFRDEAYRHQFSELSRDYMTELDRGAYSKVRPFQAICAYLLEQGDWGNLLPAVDSLVNGGKISSALTEREGRVYWCADHLDDALARQVLDVTAQGYHLRNIGEMSLRNTVTRFEANGGRLYMCGEIVNPLGVIGPNSALSGTLVLTPRRHSLQSFEFSANVRHSGSALTWQITADLHRGFRPIGVLDEVWDMYLRLEVDGTTTWARLVVSEPDVAAGSLPVRPRLTRMVGDHIEPEVSAGGHLALSLRISDPRQKVARAMIRRVFRGAPGRLAKSGLRKAKEARRKLTSGQTKIRIYHEVFSRLPRRKRLVVFESHLGKQYSDSPRALYEEMRRRGLHFDAVWSYSGGTKGFPADARLVRRWSYSYLKALAQAEFWVDNQGYPLKLAKRMGTTYIQTWHGSAFKRMGFDEPEWKLKAKPEREETQRAIDRFDRFLIRSEHDVRTLAQAFRLRDGVLLRTGYPRNDALVQARKGEALGRNRERPPLAARHGIPDDKQVLLYAPTFRSRGGARGARFELPFNVEEFADQFGDRFVLLVRAHYLNHVALPRSVQGRVIDVSGCDDVTQVLELADALITDYSSVMFDYALLDRPMLFFAYDYDSYVNEGRGVYWDLHEGAPGPVVATQDELFGEVERLHREGDLNACDRKKFVADFGEYDQGDAAGHIVDAYFTDWEH
ncbi:CDP-glycerol glycerophosphotransferase family protein [Streptomyces lavendulae]|uniref:bifunctional glycosyltransferase/CDP-glycerol:glycerophosphate glycerophosphotransferase n=1 Tax=Streptomyces lavendulae TaxID=1914 RepID=UPI0033EBE328